MALFQDAFTGTDGDEIRLRTGWALSGPNNDAWQINASNQAKSTSGNQNLIYHDAGDANHYAQITWLAGTASNLWLCCRAADVSNFVGFRNNGGTIQLYRRVAGNFFPIGTGSGSSPDGKTWKISADGSDSIVVNDGTSDVVTKTESSGNTNTNVGMMNTAGVNPMADDFEADALGGGATTVTITSSADGLLSKNLTVTSSINALLMRQDVVREASADALLTKAATITTAINALLTASQSITAQADAILLGSGTTVDAFADALLLQAKTGTISADALLLAARTSAASGDALLTKAATVTATLDALLQRAGSVTASVDAVLAAPGSNIVTASGDALLTARRSIAASINALLQQAGSLSASADAYLLKAKSVTAGIDAVLKALGQSVSVSIDAILTGEATIGHLVAEISMQPAIGGGISIQPAIDADITIN